MALYVHEVDAQVAPTTGGGEAPRSLRPEEFQALVSAVIAEIERRQQQKHRLAADAAITGRNQPQSIGT